MALPNDPATTPNLPQGNSSSDTWDPVTISNIIFSAIMVFIGIIAIWQAHRAYRHRTLDEEEIIGGIQLLSRASTMLSNASNASNSLSPSQPPQVIPASESQETHRDSTPVATADTIDNIPVAPHSSF